MIEINGLHFNDLAGFAEEFSTQALAGHQWHGNLAAFNDILRGRMARLGTWMQATPAPASPAHSNSSATASQYDTAYVRLSH